MKLSFNWFNLILLFPCFYFFYWIDNADRNSKIFPIFYYFYWIYISLLALFSLDMTIFSFLFFPFVLSIATKSNRITQLIKGIDMICPLVIYHS